MASKRPHYKRVLLKLSGEALMGSQSFGIEPSVLKAIAKEISGIQKLGVELAIVVGGGNIFRGVKSATYGMSRVPADHMGMLATVINSIALSEALNDLSLDTRVMTAIDMAKIAEPYSNHHALTHLSKGRIVIFGAGTGNPYFTTDTAAALRAVEIEAEILLKATKVGGVYDSDPEKDPNAKLFENLTYKDVLVKNLRVMDLTSVSLAMDNKLPIIVFNLREKGNMVKVISGEQIGTLIKGEDS